MSPMYRNTLLSTALMAALAAGTPAAAPRRAQAREPRSGGVHGNSAAAAPRIPTAFEPNVGQAPAGVRFVARAAAGTAWTRDDASLEIATGGGRPLRMRLAGGRAEPNADGLERVPGTISYFTGRRDWKAGVPRYARVCYAGVYPGVDVDYYAAGDDLEYDFLVAPHADPSAIRLAFDGARSVAVATDGSLVLGAEGGDVVQRAPRAYQLVGGARREVASRYALEGGRVRLELGAYDAARELVIDPVVTFAKSIGGGGWDEGRAVATDAAGFVYLAGRANRFDPAPFPSTPGSAQGEPGAGSFNAFVAKWDPSTGALVYATFLGGDGTDMAFGVAADAHGSAVVVGRVDSSDFPVAGGGLSAANSGGYDAFVAKLSPQGDRLIYSGYLGGSADDIALGVAVDRAGDAYVTGPTESGDFPTTAGALAPAFAGGFRDAFVAKVKADGSSVAYATYLGGTEADFSYGIAVDRAGSAYVAGTTNSADFPVTAGAAQASPGGGFDGFVAKLDARGAALAYATYLGGSDDENVEGTGVAVDAAGSAYVTGSTSSADFPVTAGAYQTALRGYSDAYAARLDPAGRRIVFATFVGGAGDEQSNAIAVDATGAAYVIGATSSADLPLASAVQNANGGGTVLAADPSALAWRPSSAGLPASDVTALAALPSSPGTLLAGTRGDGVYASADGGATWTPSSAGLQERFVTALLVDAASPSTVYAAVAAEDAVTGGIYKSADGGHTWSRAGAAGLSAAVQGLAQSRTNPAVLYAYTSPVAGDAQGIYMTADGGAHWNGPALAQTSITSMAVDPSDANIVYAGTFRLNVFKSVDGGRTWQEKDRGLGNAVVAALLVDPADPRTVYAGTHTMDEDGGAVFVSHDGGESWEPDSPFYFNTNAMLMDPSDPSTLYAGTWHGVFKTTDGGRTWGPASLANTRVASLALGGAGGSRLFAGVGLQQDAFAVRLAPDGAGVVYATYLGTSGGDAGFGVALDRDGNAFVAGSSGAETLAAKWDGQSTFAGGEADAFVARLTNLDVTHVSAKGAKLVVEGAGFAAGAKVLVDGAAVKTKLAGRRLVAPGAARAIAHGETVSVSVRLPNGLESPAAAFTMP